jgi:hypothetical protein
MIATPDTHEPWPEADGPRGRGAVRQFLGPRLLAPGGGGFENRGGNAAAWRDPE